MKETYTELLSFAGFGFALLSDPIERKLPLGGMPCESYTI